MPACKACTCTCLCARAIYTYRAVVKELQGYTEPLAKLLARLRVVAATDAKYKVWLPDLEKASKELGEFVDASLNSIWAFEALNLAEARPPTLCSACTIRRTTAAPILIALHIQHT